MAASGTILIVDDEEDLRTLLQLAARREGYDTVTAASGAEALGILATLRPDLIVLDLMLPDLSGTEVCRRIRATPELADTPVIMLTARGEEIDRVVGFEVGADDYVVKSQFSVREFLLRVRAVLRRRAAEEAPAPAPAAGPAEGTTFRAEAGGGVLRLDAEAHRAFVDDEEVPLTATEFKLLRTLAARPGRVQSRGALLEEVWEVPPDLNTRTVDTHMKRLREKLGAAANLIETVRGVGYRFDASGGPGRR